MKSGILLLLGIAGAGAALFMVHNAHANAPSSSVWPTGWTPPGNSATRNLPSSNPTQLALRITTWAQPASPGGAAAGTFQLVQNAANPANDWAVFFNGSPMQVGATQNSTLIAQAVAAGLVK
jgi:hypothetical protein